MIVRSPYPDIEIPDLPLTPFVLRQAERLDDKPALIDATSGQMLTYRQLAHGVESVASGLARRGYRKGDVLAICAPNILEYAIAFHAVTSLGGVVTMINPLSTGDELVQRLIDAKAHTLLTTPEALGRTRAAIDRVELRERIVFGSAPGATSFDSLTADNSPPAPIVPIDPRNELAALPYSSGSSGLPKGVMLTHRNLVAGLGQFAVAAPIAREEVVFASLPFFHMLGLATMNLVLSQGATLVVTPRFELAAFLHALHDLAVTRVFTVPPIVIELAKSPCVTGFDLSRLKIIHCGAAPLGETVLRRCADRLGCAVKQGYALTEGFPAIRMGPDDREMSRANSVGRCVPNTECKVVDPETGADLGPGQAGELLLRGPQIMQGYLNQPEATAEAIDHEGWLRTGDIGWVDDEGYFTIVDRLKEMIKYKGYQVAPAELEAVLLSHPAVADVAVIPSPDDEAGEVAKAFVVLEGEATAEELMGYVADRVAPYKKVRRVEFTDQIPRSASGKILRQVLVARERDLAATPVLA